MSQANFLIRNQKTYRNLRVAFTVRHANRDVFCVVLCPRKFTGPIGEAKLQDVLDVRSLSWRIRLVNNEPDVLHLTYRLTPRRRIKEVVFLWTIKWFVSYINLSSYSYLRISQAHSQFKFYYSYTFSIRPSHPLWQQSPTPAGLWQRAAEESICGQSAMLLS